MPNNTIAAEVEAIANQANQAARAMQRLGFRVLHIGPTISVQGSESLWESVFNVTFAPRTKAVLAGIEGSEVAFRRAVTESLRIPAELHDLVTGVQFVEPPEFYRSG